MSGPNQPMEVATVGLLQTARRARLQIDVQKFSPAELRQVCVRKFTVDPRPDESEEPPKFWPTKQFITVPADKLPAMILLLQQASETIHRLDAEEGV